MSDDVVDDRPPRDVFCGWTADDQYTCFGHLYGPGIAKDVPANRADHLEKAIKRVNSSREEKSRVDPTSLRTPRPVALADATDGELLEIMSQRGLLQQPVAPQHQDEPIDGVSADQLKAMQETADRIEKEKEDKAKADAQLAAANAQAMAAAAKLVTPTATTPPPSAPPPPPAVAR